MSNEVEKIIEYVYVLKLLLQGIPWKEGVGVD